MASLTIHLPDELVKRAERVGLLESEKMVELLQQAVEKQENSLYHLIQSLPIATSYDQNPLDIQKDMRNEW